MTGCVIVEIYNICGLYVIGEVGVVEDKFKRALLNLLTKDAEVINTVKRIIASEEIYSENKENQESALLYQIEKLKKEIDFVTQQKNLLDSELLEQKKELKKKDNDLNEQKEKLEEKEQDLKQKDKEIESIRSKYYECKKEKEEITEKYNYFKRKYSEYSELDAVYNKYLNLGESIIKRMERILNHSSDYTEAPEVFMAYGTQENNIVALWESIAANFDFYDSQGKTEDLIDIFQYFLKLYKEITFKNIQIDWPNIGDAYDERKHTRTSLSSAVGKIQKVILPGFSIGKSVTKKSLVIVK